jgi:hypothetical protein
MHYFISVVKPMPHEQVLLILDGHSSHTQSLAAIEITRRHGVVMLSLPSHSTHQMQPLDVTFFKQLNTFMSSAIATKLREKPGQRLSTEHIASLVGMAFPRAATIQTAVNGLRNSGLWPVDRNVFTDADFVPSVVTHAIYIQRSLQPQNKLQDIMDTFLWKMSVYCLQTPQNVRIQSQERNALHLVWC